VKLDLELLNEDFVRKEFGVDAFEIPHNVPDLTEAHVSATRIRSSRTQQPQHFQDPVYT
jgi:hypothetical protein